MSKRFSRFFAILTVLGLGLPGASHAQESHKKTSIPITHVIMIMQENRSFDHYFGTFPGADGIPAGTCVPLNPATPSAGCVVPFHDYLDINAGGPHQAMDTQADLDDGITTFKNDGYVHQQTTAGSTTCGGSAATVVPTCASTTEGVLTHDVMGYHTAQEIPNYWAYASNFALQDHMFADVRSWSLPVHLAMTSLWSATCTNPKSALSCTSATQILIPTSKTVYPWATLFQFFDVNNVTWKYYLGAGTEPDCESGEFTCPPVVQAPAVPSQWNVVPFYGYYKAQTKTYQTSHVVNSDQFLLDLQGGTLPQVSWIVPSDEYSEHPPSGITEGQNYVTALINAVMQSPYWNSTVIFLAWDDWGGFYDHELQPNVDTNTSTTPIQGYGQRVPGITISPWVKPGLIDHSVYSFDAYATFIEDIFMNSQRLNPAALGNPDNRPDQRDALTSVSYLNGTTTPVGNLLSEFDFTQTPLAPLVLSTYTPSSIVASCGQNPTTTVCTTSTVTVTWRSVSDSQIKGPFTYHVTRDGVALTKCVTTKTTCTDTPGSGTHYYRVWSVSPASAVSNTSAAAVAQEP